MVIGGNTYRRFTSEGANHVGPYAILNALALEAAKHPDPPNPRGWRNGHKLVWTDLMLGEG